MMSVLGIFKDQYEERPDISEHLEQQSKREVLYDGINDIMYPDFYIKRFGTGASIFACSDNYKGSLFLDWGGHKINMDGDPDLFKKAVARLEENGFEVTVTDAVARRQAKDIIAETMGLGYSVQIDGRRVDVFQPHSLCSMGSVEFGWHSNNIEIFSTDPVEYANLAKELETRGFKISFNDHHRSVEKITPELISKRRQQAEADYQGAVARGYESVSNDNHRRREIRESRNPTPWKIKKAIDSGATAADIDNLFYPGESSRCDVRKSRYPIPEGTGRDRWSPETNRVVEFKHNQFTIGVRERTSFYKGDVWIGHIDEMRRGMCDIFFRAHDGEEFAHWGGPEGAETYLIDRYWLYGNPPEPKKSIVEILSSKITKTKNAEPQMTDDLGDVCEKSRMNPLTKQKEKIILYLKKKFK